MQQADRVAALAELARIEHVLAMIAPWLDDQGHERAAVLIEDAWRDVLAASALIDRDPGRIKVIVPDGRALAASENGHLRTLTAHLRKLCPLPMSKNLSAGVRCRHLTIPPGKEPTYMDSEAPQLVYVLSISADGTIVRPSLHSSLEGAKRVAAMMWRSHSGGLELTWTSTGEYDDEWDASPRPGVAFTIISEPVRPDEDDSEATP